MACNLQTLSGCKIEVATGVAVADCSTELVAADYSSVTWTVLGGVQSGGYTGQQWNTSDIKPLSGGSKKAKAGHDSGTLSVNVAWESTDAGMVILESAYASDTDEVATRITYPNGVMYCSQGLVTGLPLPSGTQDDVMARDVVVSLNHRPATA